MKKGQQPAVWAVLNLPWARGAAGFVLSAQAGSGKLAHSCRGWLIWPKGRLISGKQARRQCGLFSPNLPWSMSTMDISLPEGLWLKPASALFLPAPAAMKKGVHRAVRFVLQRRAPAADSARATRRLPSSLLLRDLPGTPLPGAFSSFSGRNTMLKYAIIFAIISLIAGALGFGGIAAGSAGIAKILFGLFLILAVVFIVLAALGVGAARKALK